MYQLTAEQIVNVIREYGGLQNMAATESIVAVAACTHCGADIDQYCRNTRSGKAHAGSLHAARRLAAEMWRKSHAQEWKQLKRDLLLRFVQVRLSKTVSITASRIENNHFQNTGYATDGPLPYTSEAK